MKTYKQTHQTNTLTDDTIPYIGKISELTTENQDLSLRFVLRDFLLWYRENEGSLPVMTIENIVEKYILKSNI